MYIGLSQVVIFGIVLRSRQATQSLLPIDLLQELLESLAPFLPVRFHTYICTNSLSCRPIYTRVQCYSVRAKVAHSYIHTYRHTLAYIRTYIHKYLTTYMHKHISFLGPMCIYSLSAFAFMFNIYALMHKRVYIHCIIAYIHA